MLSLFHRKRPSPTPGSTPSPPIAMPKGLTRPQSAASLLATPRRQKLLEHIWQRTSLSRRQFASLYLAPLERYAELVQQFPASESHHHAYPGGMLDHGMEIVAYALKLRQSHLLPAGAPPEAQAAQAEAWTAGAAYAALLHDIGKIAIDLHVEHADGSIWKPWHGPLKRPYRFRYRKEREYRLHSAATGLLYVHVLDGEIFDWLSGYPDLWAPLLYVLAGQYENAGILGELVAQADRASVAHELGGDPTKVMAAPRHALQRKLLEGLRYLLKEEFKLNQPQASDGWLTQDALWLVSKTVSDKLRAYLLAQGIEGIPTSNVTLFNILQDHGIAQATAQGKAIWKITVTSSVGWSHSFTVLKLVPALIWEVADRPTPFAGTVQLEQDASVAEVTIPDESEKVILNETAAMTTSETRATSSKPAPPTIAPMKDNVDALLGLLQTGDVPPTATESPKPLEETTKLGSDVVLSAPRDATTYNPTITAEVNISGEHFMDWIKCRVQTRKLIINDAKALVHTVSDTVYLVSPGIFQRYAQEHPQTSALAKQDQVSDWQWVQKRFEKLRLHRKQSDGLNIWTCEVTGPRKSRRLHGYLLETGSMLFEQMPPNNPYLALLDE